MGISKNQKICIKTRQGQQIQMIRKSKEYRISERSKQRIGLHKQKRRIDMAKRCSRQMRKKDNSVIRHCQYFNQLIYNQKSGFKLIQSQQNLYQFFMPNFQQSNNLSWYHLSQLSPNFQFFLLVPTFFPSFPDIITLLFIFLLFYFYQLLQFLFLSLFFYIFQNYARDRLSYPYHHQLTLAHYFLFPFLSCFFIYLNNNYITREMQSFGSFLSITNDENGQTSSEIFKGPFLLLKSSTADVKNFARNAEWTIIEKAKYLAFIQHNMKKMEGRCHSKLWNIYKQMEEFISTRNFRQCKSYHQKMVEQFKQISLIVKYVLSEFPETRENVENYKEELQRKPVKMMECLIKKDDLKITSSTSCGYEGAEGEGQLQNQGEQGNIKREFREWSTRVVELLQKQLINA